jgi:hypothetical protein
LGLTAPDQLDHTSLEGMDRASEHDFEFWIVENSHQKCTIVQQSKPVRQQGK